MSFSPGCATGTPHNLIKVTQCVLSPLILPNLEGCSPLSFP